ncbi:MAG: hypothetical protein WCB27_11410 [Thermoguttaceae bacterium]
MQVSLYDRVSSLLLALLLTSGVVATVLFVLWLGKTVGVNTVAVPCEITEVSEDGEGGGDGRPAGGSQLDTPSDEPVVGNDKESVDLQQDLQVLDTTVASQAVELDDPELVVPTRKGSFGSGGGIYGGFGDGRGMGHGRGKPGWPRHWEVMFSRATLEAYAKQLDFFKIELAVLQPGNKIIYAFNLAKPRPDTRIVTNPALNERRYYLTWRTGEMQQADRDLLAKAGIDPEGRLILKFLPKEVELDLMAKERAFNNLTPKDIKKTRFGVQPEGDGFKFYVMEQIIKR